MQEGDGRCEWLYIRNGYVPLECSERWVSRSGVTDFKFCACTSPSIFVTPFDTFIAAMPALWKSSVIRQAWELDKLCLPEKEQLLDGST